MGIAFEWDEAKAESNRRKHGVTFEEAITCFADTLSLTIPDPDHSVGEHRYLLLGYSHRQRLLVVAHVEVDEGATIRLISARPADRGEQRHYEQGV